MVRTGEDSAREDELLRLQRENAELKKANLDKGEQVKHLGVQLTRIRNDWQAQAAPKALAPVAKARAAAEVSKTDKISELEVKLAQREAKEQQLMRQIELLKVGGGGSSARGPVTRQRRVVPAGPAEPARPAATQHTALRDQTHKCTPRARPRHKCKRARSAPHPPPPRAIAPSPCPTARAPSPVPPRAEPLPHRSYAGDRRHRPEAPEVEGQEGCARCQGEGVAEGLAEAGGGGDAEARGEEPGEGEEPCVGAQDAESEQAPRVGEEGQEVRRAHRRRRPRRAGTLSS